MKPASFAPFVAVSTAALLAIAGSASAFSDLPIGFVTEKIGANWDHPVTVAFLSNDRMLVGEKRGRIWYLEHETKHNVVLDIDLEVLNLLDRGLLCVTPDPSFDTNGWVYLLYAVDPEADGIDGNQEAYCRLERWTLTYDGNGDLNADPNSRLDLIGDVWATGIPSCHFSHSVGTLRFMSDGSLVASCGDGAHYENIDHGGQDAQCFVAGHLTPDQDIGAFRSQYSNSLAGKLLRIDPATGLGLPDNPWFDGNPGSIPSRTYALGLRNPFRFCLLPGTGPRETVVVCDVGWNAWEELDLAHGGENFGWPCREGTWSPGYAPYDPGGFCNGLVETPPLLTWNHGTTGTLGFNGNCASGAVVYQGTSYPPAFRGALFFCDYGKNWLRCLRLDANEQVTAIVPFGTAMGRPIDLQTDPASGDLVYISYVGLGEIRRIRYIGSNAPPVAVASVSPSFGPTPLTIAFDCLASYDPENGTVDALWDFGDGTTSNSVADEHVYTDAQNHDLKLTLTDDFGNTTTEAWLISPGNTPPQVTSVVVPPPQFAFQSGVPFEVAATAFDAEDDAAGLPVDVRWSANLIQGHQEHPDFAEIHAPAGAFTLESQAPGSYFEIVCTVTDSRGLTDSRTSTAYDADAKPAPHLVSISDVTPRLGQRIHATAHVEYPNAGYYEQRPSLACDWGDGRVDVFPDLRHQFDVTMTHDYAAAGDYTLRLSAVLGAYTNSVTQAIRVEKPRPAVAVFTPLLNSGFIVWNDQQQIAQAIRSELQARGVECVVFTYAEQQELVDWMTPYLDDGVQDVLVILDSIPAALFSGQADGSLAERWVELGNGILWSGNEPFSEYIQSSGAVDVIGAGGHGSEKFFDTAPGTYPCRGSGAEIVTPLGATEMTYLPPNWWASFSLRLWRLDPNVWKVGKVYALDDVEYESDAVLVRNSAGGFFAQLFDVDDNALDRVHALPQFLLKYHKPLQQAPATKPPPWHPGG